ncbi:MAG: DUF3108 domain-containing protein [Candidatus Omnitrophota bacterium]
MRRSFFLFFILILTGAAYSASCARNISRPNSSVFTGSLQDTSATFGFQNTNPALLKRETLSYSVILKGIKVGSANLSFVGPIKFQRQDANLVIFSSSALNFSDIEKIYANPPDYLPLRIERDLNLWGNRIKISEEYDQKQNSVRITRSRVKPNIINLDSNIQNIILLVYKYRDIEKLEIGQSDLFNLPTKKINIKLIRQEAVKVPAGIFQAYLFESDPAGYKFWLSVDKDKLPLKLQGFSYLGATSLVLSKAEAD